MHLGVDRVFLPGKAETMTCKISRSHCWTFGARRHFPYSTEELYPRLGLQFIEVGMTKDDSRGLPLRDASLDYEHFMLYGFPRQFCVHCFHLECDVDSD